MATDWSTQQLAKLLPLDTETLKQILDYSASLSDIEAAEHLKNLLGDSPQAFEFISSFNQRRKAAAPSKIEASTPSAATSEDDRVPRGQAKQKKKKAPLNALPAPRRPEDYGNVQGSYQKRDEEDYMPSKRKDLSSQFSLSKTPAAKQMPTLLDPALHNVHTRVSPARSTNASPAHSRGTSPSRKSKSTKVSIPGGTAMHGASTTMSDLDSAIRALELSTNPSIPPPDPNLRRCQCMGSQHPILAAAPNCLSCGKIICAKEGFAPCTFCGSALLSGEQVQDMIESLRRERASERIAANNAAQAARAGKVPDEALAQAQAHRDRLLGFQATNAQRTKVVDEAAAFETPDSGVTQWGSAEERAAQLRLQQKILREMEWNAKPEYEKRRMVVSVDIKGGKAIKRMQEISYQDVAPDLEVSGVEEIVPVAAAKPEGNGGGGSGGGAFAKNPLLGKLVKPVWKAENEDGIRRTEGRNPWRRVQDDIDDNEEVILNGGIYGGREQERIFAEEPACG